MSHNCPTCNDELAGRARERCPECGTIWSDAAIAGVRREKHTQSRIDAVGYGCLTVLCLFISAVMIVAAIDYGASVLGWGSLAVLLLAGVFGHRLHHRVRRWNDE